MLFHLPSARAAATERTLLLREQPSTGGEKTAANGIPPFLASGRKRPGKGGSPPGPFCLGRIRLAHMKEGEMAWATFSLPKGKKRKGKATSFPPLFIPLYACKGFQKRSFLSGRNIRCGGGRGGRKGEAILLHHRSRGNYFCADTKGGGRIVNYLQCPRHALLNQKKKKKKRGGERFLKTSWFFDLGTVHNKMILRSARGGCYWGGGKKWCLSPMGLFKLFKKGGGGGGCAPGFWKPPNRESSSLATGTSEKIFNPMGPPGFTLGKGRAIYLVLLFYFWPVGVGRRRRGGKEKPRNLLPISAFPVRKKKKKRADVWVLYHCQCMKQGPQTGTWKRRRKKKKSSTHH